MATSKTKTVSKELKNLTPSMADIKQMAKLGTTVMAGLYTAEIGSRVMGNLALDRLPDVPYISKKTVGSGITAMALWIGYKHVPKVDIPFVGLNTKQVMKYACAGAFARTIGGLAVDVASQLNFNPFGITGYVEEVIA